MEHLSNVAKSLPPFPEEGDKDTFSSSGIFSAATHPSIQTRNKDDLLNRIRSGNDVLCRLPTRLDPNISFSDDEEEDIAASHRSAAAENRAPRAHEPQHHLKSVHTLPNKRGAPPNPFRENFTLRGSGGNALNPRQRYHSASKVSGGPLRERRPAPISEMKPRNSAKTCLMEQHEFKIPPLPPVTPRDTIVVRGKPYSVLSQLGSGGSCKVFSAIDAQNALVAVKCVDLKGTDPLIREGYKKEISYLQRLQGSDRVIKMHDYEYRENELFLVLERGEIDFARYISNEAKRKRLTPLTVKFYWQQMLEAVADIHALGIVHSDLKPANFLLVSGNLKLIDFGIATSVPEDKTSTFRDTQVGTLNYMSPEAVTALSSSTGGTQVQFKVGVKSDVWSLGCILYNLAYGATPFHAARTLMQKICAITSPEHRIEFRPLPDTHLVDVLKRCLERDVKKRASVKELLEHPYLREAPRSTEERAAPQSDQLTKVMEQMQVLTPRRMSLLTQMVKQLSEEKKEGQT
ncbi:hypothetical protein JTE90_006098 [Oedothorax gibbosus]|uniref:Protein kinase domain-containing protein n=1 Tax=Oedothorax gibbosus TaxID=931172 RepID=A0AAV6V3K2_9ARAC|nr:hypothetical protein JTE90_006098 [Oedothorax gibbosus]